MPEMPVMPEMPLGLALGALLVVVVNALIAIYMVREPGKQHPVYFAGMFNGGLITFMATCDVPAFSINEVHFGAKPTIPVIGPILTAMFSIFGNPPIPADWVDPQLVFLAFYGLCLAALYLGVAKLLHLRPFQKGKATAGGSFGPGARR
jgi:hypothetical protein